MKKNFSPMQFITQYAIIFVPLFPMSVVALATFFFARRAEIHPLLALLMAAVAAVAIELAGISAFRTLVSVYQSFKRHQLNHFIIAEFTLLLAGVIIYLSAIGLAAAVLDQEFKGSWPLGAMAGLLAIAVYVVRAVGETYQISELELEQDTAFDRRRREFALEQQAKDAEHRRKVELKDANIRTYEARATLEQAKSEQSNPRPRTPVRTQTERPRTASNVRLQAPAGASRTFRQAFGEQQTKQNRTARSERLEQLLRTLAEQPNISQNEAARTIGVAPSTCSDYVSELTTAGRLSRNGGGWHITSPPPSGGPGGAGGGPQEEA